MFKVGFGDLKRSGLPTCGGLNRSLFGFTLAELLIALAILGVIATFSIPKVLQSQQDQKFKSIAKETVAAISGAYDAYRLENAPGPSTRIHELTPYLNYVRVDSSSWVDQVYGDAGPIQCNNVGPRCLLLHNGAMLDYAPDGFGGTGSTNALVFAIDPDGKVTQTGSPANGPGKKALFFLYFNGRITSYGNCFLGTQANTWAPGCPVPSKEPPWFKWD